MLKNNQSNPFYCVPNKTRIEKGSNPIKQGKAKVLDLEKFRNKKQAKTKAKFVFAPWIEPSKVFSSLTKLTSEN